MGRRSNIDDLPAEIRQALKTLLRSNAYGPLDEVLSWARERGFTGSRSGLGRWVKNLKKQDAELGIDPELKTKTGAPLIDLWERLEQLRAEERDILAQIRTMTLPK